MFDIDTLVNSPYLYRTEFDDWKFIWRPLTMKEYRIFFALRATGGVHPYVIYKQVFERCFIGDSTMLSNNMPMFIPITLGMLIMHVSGDSNRETLVYDIGVTRASYANDDIYEIIKRTICLAFPNEDFFALEKLNRYELFDKFAAAEAYLVWSTANKYEPIDLSKITFGDEQVAAPQNEQMEFINFEQENQQMYPSLSIEERSAASSLPPQNSKITSEQARKLDNLRRG